VSDLSRLFLLEARIIVPHLKGPQTPKWTCAFDQFS